MALKTQKTTEQYKGALISIIHRQETNDHIYAITVPVQFTGMATTLNAAQKQARKDVDAFMAARGS